jgi:hypothetical protein
MPAEVQVQDVLAVGEDNINRKSHSAAIRTESASIGNIFI